ncbi:MAG: transcription termination/antitermination protein NusA [Halobacteriovoraceae bacterium]|nr:transcription termination/antitermination protein NusA [Halobacteriovoraceae bacterium]MCB9095709.1 transcription termination/antitermination protein NusA [Halobacteriovoraceae bacterium]
MDFSELGRVIEQIGKDRGIRRDIVVGAIEQAFVVTARKKYGIHGEFEARYNEDDGDIEIYQYKTVVDNVKDKITEIELNSAKELDEDAEIGDQLGLKIEDIGFTRVDIQTAKQIIFQKVRDAERDILFSEFKHREGELVTGIARRFERGNVIVDLGKADAILPKREIIFGESFKPGDRIQAYLSEVVMTNRGPEIRLSRTSPLFLVKLFEVEVPEIQDGTIEIMAAAREPGHRAKIAVYTKDRDIDPVGACVGMKGSRVQNIVNELQGEKIDIVKWSDDLETFTRAALAPADITSISLNQEDKIIDVIVEDDQLSLAIGRRGQNVRLASMLTSWKVNIVSKSKLQEKVKLAVENLIQLDGLNEATAQVLVQGGVMSIVDLSASAPDEIAQIVMCSEEDAQKYIDSASAAVEKGELKIDIEEEEEIISASAIPGRHGYIRDRDEHRADDESDDHKFSEAEKRLREELAAFKLK